MSVAFPPPVVPPPWRMVPGLAQLAAALTPPHLRVRVRRPHLPSRGRLPAHAVHVSGPWGRLVWSGIPIGSIMQEEPVSDQPPAGSLQPQRAIRRFDVFAEVKRLEALAEGKPEDEAKGYGIWLAKVVAGRRFGAVRKVTAVDAPRDRPASDAAGTDLSADRFRSAGGEVQTDETFDQEVIERMGPDFYDRVFSPAIRAALDRGETYEEMRDTIRASWKTRRASERIARR